MGLVLVVALALAGMIALATGRLPGVSLARSLAERLLCAARITGECDPDRSRLVAAYGPELGELAIRLAPELRYEEGMRALPVDYRSCRRDGCADGAEQGAVARSLAGEPTTAFLHVVDCRPDSPTFTAAADCRPPARGHVYLQYWFYYPGSATAEGSIAPQLVRSVSTALGVPTYHRDDWESVQIRIGPGRPLARASSHHGYGRGWMPFDGSLNVSGGSHAGTLAPREFDRHTPADRLTLLPLEDVVGADGVPSFAVSPPWRKRVWLAPEYGGTD